jgi:hypothetical protein
MLTRNCMQEDVAAAALKGRSAFIPGNIDKEQRIAGFPVCEERQSERMLRLLYFHFGRYNSSYNNKVIIRSVFRCRCHSNDTC